ncbi:MAG: hypothetical protein K2J62_00010 [Bacteroidales bacterium]|nr:hypothetical protein [Bacteroidales bacterium]
MSSIKWLPAILAALSIFVLNSCEKHPEPETFPRRVFLLYSAGHSNGLAGALADNIRDITGEMTFPDNSALLIYSHISTSSYPTESYLIRAYRKNGKSVMDTLVTYPAGTHSASAETLRKVLEDTRERFPADEYGLLFSSHGTGFLPEYYYSNSSRYEALYSQSAERIQKSIGQEKENGISYEIDIRDFADAIPFRLDYIIFDACLMGGAEVACQLRTKARYLVASPAEILSYGMDYKNMAGILSSNASLQSRLQSCCRCYYDIYASQSSQAWRSATISLIDLSETANLAIECSRIFERHRENLQNIDFSTVQQYYTYNYHWFYDLCDIVEKLGCTEEELERFHEAFDRCVIYKEATESFLANSLGNPYPGFVINRYGGLSMYLPCNGGAYLDSYYKTLDWNFATRLVE